MVSPLRLISFLIIFLLPICLVSQVLSVQFSSTEPTCFDLPTGRIRAIPIGGTQPYAYRWSTRATTQTIDNLKAGTYFLTVTDALNRTVSDSFVLSQPAILAVRLERIVCGIPTTVKAVASGGVGPYSYAWETGSTFDTTQVSVEQKYCVTVTDSKLCANITCEPVPITPMVVALDTRNVSCFGFQDGQLVATGGGGKQPYTYRWSNGQTTREIRNLSPGLYTVTLTESGGCSKTGSARVIEPTRLTIPLTVSQPACAGDNTGRIAALPQGGNAPYRFSWSTGSNSPTIDFLPSGTYGLTVVDAKGCVNTATTLIQSQSAISLFTTSRAETCLGQGDGELRVSPVGGVGPYRFKWNSGETDSLIGLKVTGNYVVTVTDALGCVKSANVLMTAAASAFRIELTRNGPICNGTDQGNISLILQGGQAPFQVAWNTGSTGTALRNLRAGTYRVTITDAIGCRQVLEETIRESPPIFLDIDGEDRVCGGATNARLRTTVTGGVAPFVYRWSNGRTGPNIENVGAGTHYLTLTDANNCVVRDSFFIARLPTPVVSLIGDQIVCNNGRGALSASVSGSPGPYLYAWSNGQTGAAVGNLASGEYALTVEDANRCVTVLPFQIQIIDSLKPDVLFQVPRCKGESNAFASVASVAGGVSPFSYAWSNGSTASSLSGLPTGNYSLTISDRNGCQAIREFPLAEAAFPLQVETQVTDIRCGIAGTGGINLLISGGFPPYQQRWSDGSLTRNRTSLRAGLYLVTVTDANGCPVTRSITVSDPGNPVCNVAITRPLTFPNLNDGEALLAPSGGVAPYTVFWSDGQVGYRAVNLENRTYQLTLTDAKGCVTTCTVNPQIGNALVGNRVWSDTNLDGLQTPGEPGVSNVTVFITRLDSLVERYATTQTDASGLYYFSVPPGQYKITFQVPTGRSLTNANVDSPADSLDSDADRLSGMTAPFTIGRGEVNLTFDAGLIPSPQALATNTICLNNATRTGNGQFQSTLEVRSGIPKQTWRLIQHSGMYNALSLPTPNLPQPLASGMAIPEVRPGVYQLTFRHVDAKPFNARVTNGTDTLRFQGESSYPLVPVANLPSGQLTLCESGGSFKFRLDSAATGSLNVTLNGKLISEINPAELGKGNFNLEINYNNPALLQECATVLDISLVVQKDSCLAKLGDRVWNDLNQNGLQDPGEPGLRNVRVILSAIEGNKVRDMDTTLTDSTGMYMFNVPGGKYKLTFGKPSPDYAPTPWLRGTNRQLDSDMNPFTLMTEFITVDTGVNRMDIDAGFYLECRNIASAGEIGFNQLLCGAGNDPVKIVNVTSPSGAAPADMEYLWMYSTERPLTFDMNLFSPIPDSDSPEYDPGPLYRTTWYARCVRKRGCYEFLETNVVKIEVGNRASARIVSPPTMCLHGNNFLEVQTSTGAGQVTWDLGPGFQSSLAYGFKPAVRFTGTGTFTFKVTVIERECTVSASGSVTVTTNPVYCPSIQDSETMTIIAVVMPGFDVKLSWRSASSQQIPTYIVERSMDGVRFSRISEKSYPIREADGMKYYEYTDKPDKMGLHYYRVSMRRDNGLPPLTSNLEKVMLMDNPDKRSMVFPNPVTDVLMVEYYVASLEDIEISLINGNGASVREWRFPPGPAASRVLSLKDVPPGIYALRIVSGSGIPVTERIIKH